MFLVKVHPGLGTPYAYRMRKPTRTFLVLGPSVESLLLAAKAGSRIVLRLSLVRTIDLVCARHMALNCGMTRPVTGHKL